MFLGHRLSPGGEWKGDYYVANLSDLRSGKRLPRIQRVRSIIADNAGGWIFPMKDLYDFVQRSGMYKNVASRDTDDDSEKPVFDFAADKAGDISSGAERAETNRVDNEASFVDYYEENKDEGTCTYHHFKLRKRLFVPKCSPS